MSSSKSNISKNVSFGLYRIKHEYINALRKKDPNVIDPEINDLYCGPVYQSKNERGAFAYYVPVDENYYDSKNSFLTEFVQEISHFYKR